MMVHVTQDPISSPRLCAHCNRPLADGVQGLYCCAGCRKAHDLIRRYELDEYYALPRNATLVQVRKSTEAVDYSIYDKPAEQKRFLQEVRGEGREASFFLDDMSCYACVWLCEKVTKKIDPTAELSINLGNGEAVLRLGAQSAPLSEFFKAYEDLGYGVHPAQSDRAGDRTEIMRLGLAFFCLMNIMMLAMPDYLATESLEPRYRLFFQSVSAVLAAISVFYCGRPILGNAWAAVRHKQLPLDLPIGLALALGYAYSLGHVFMRSPLVYFDSMAGVVALLLTGRFIQSRALRKIQNETISLLNDKTNFVRVIDQGSLRVVPLADVVRGQTIRILPGEVIAVDIQLKSPRASISYGLLRGESETWSAFEGQWIEAGALNGSEPIEGLVVQDGRDSLIMRIRQASHDLFHHKGRFLALSEKLAKAFVLFVLTMATGILIWKLPADPGEGFKRFTSVLLVACPCIFGFGAPLVIARAFQLGLKRGLIFRSQKALERLAEVREFYFDKTGTLTVGDITIERAEWLAGAQLPACERGRILAVLRRLPEFTAHYVSVALAAWAVAVEGEGSASVPSIVRAEEIFGQGVKIHCDLGLIKIGRAAFCAPHASDEAAAAAFYVSLNDNIVLSGSVGERLRPEAASCVAWLTREGLRSYIASGDSPDKVDRVRENLGLAPGSVRSRLTPEQKFFSILRPRLSAFIGNGINDALAASGTAIGIALSDADESMKASSDLCFKEPGLAPLIDAIDLSRECRRVLRRCFALALGFNAIGMSLALSGVVTPVMAAVLMPVSSLTVFVSSQSFRPRRPSL